MWAEPERCETDGAFQRIRALAPPPPGAHAPLAISAPGVVEGLLADVRRTDVDALAPFRQPDGSYRQNNVFRYVIADRPA